MKGTEKGESESQKVHQEGNGKNYVILYKADGERIGTLNTTKRERKERNRGFGLGKE